MFFNAAQAVQKDWASDLTSETFFNAAQAVQK